jgi:hypothetical protein
MCSPKNPAKKAAKKARKEEDARQQAIRDGRARIDASFAGFDQGYFDGLAADFKGYYMPQLEDQYGKAKEQSIYGLARQGILEGSAGAERLGEVDKKYQEQRTLIADRAVDQAMQARAAVDANKGDLYAQLSATADPTSAALSATARAQALATPPVYSPLGEVFLALSGAATNAIEAERSGWRGWNTGWFRPSQSRVSII